MYLCSWFDTLLGEGLDDIADLVFREIVENNTAFVTTGNLSHIVFATT